MFREGRFRYSETRRGDGLRPSETEGPRRTKSGMRRGSAPPRLLRRGATGSPEPWKAGASPTRKAPSVGRGGARRVQGD